MLDAHRLRIFRAVVASGSINGAATSLGYTASAVSQHLTALQRQTGLTLIERRGRGIEPTAAGLTFARESGPVLERLAALESVAGDLRAGRVGKLTVSYFASAGAAWIPPVVATLAREFPLLRFDLRLIELAGEAPYVPDVEVFIAEAIAATGELPETEGYGVRLLLEEGYLVVVPAGHRLADRTEVALAELREEPWVDNDFSRGPCRQVMLTACATVGFTPTFQVETHDYPSAIAFVAAGVGITVLPRLGTVTLPAGVRAIPVVKPVPRRRIMVRVKRSVRDHPAVLRSVQLLQEHAAAAPEHALVSAVS
ncbi:MAG: LysR family transcriptional regulator [Actinomycetota bacterium]|nr:LysR family transcriptional regulator [Actinomycetota bacterium]